MDMTRYLKEYLTVAVLDGIGGFYEGIIDEVNNELLRNPYSKQRSEEGVISFVDGRRLVLNKSMLKACITWFGTDSEDWIGRRIQVSIRPVETRNRETGETRVRFQRRISCEDPHATGQSKSVRSARASAHHREPGEDDVTPDTSGADITAEQIFEKDPVTVLRGEPSGGGVSNE
jgi:hypothetical protein